MDDVKQHKLARFMETTGIDADAATQFLESANWDVDVAGSTYFADDLDPSGPSASYEVPDNYTGPRTLDGRPVPDADMGQSSSSASKRAKTSKAPAKGRRTGLATFSELRGREEESDDDDDDRPRNFFTGGEKSGLAVQDPKMPMPENDADNETNEILRGIWDQAHSNVERMRHEAESSTTNSRFSGAARTLGGDGVESRHIPDPSAHTAPAEPEEEPEQREIHLWSNGFSVGAGPLHPFSDPRNQNILRMIHGGHAPMELLNVRPGQPVNVSVIPHQEEWRQLPKPKEAFAGQGQRLGAPVPGIVGESSSSNVSAPPAAAQSSSAPDTRYNPDEPSVAIRIQMPSGQRVMARFNLTQTVGDIYNHVHALEPATFSGRNFVIATTFPNKNHTERNEKLGDMAEFKKGGVAVVKWV